jgi:hypothetical protein
LGSIGGWTITSTDLQRQGAGGLGTSTLNANGLTVVSAASSSAQNSVEHNSLNIDFNAGSTTIPTITSTGTGTTALSIQPNGNLLLHSVNGFVYASSQIANPSTANGNKVLTGSAGVSTKIVKTNIQHIDYNQLDSFLNLIQPKKFTNIMKNKEKISLIIEDEEDRNIPFKNILFKREEKLYTFKTLPSYLLPYENDTEVIQKEYLPNSTEIVGYYFSPKVLDEQTLHGLTLAAAKYNHTRIKDLEEENQKLKDQIASIKQHLGI